MLLSEYYFFIIAMNGVTLILDSPRCCGTPARVQCTAIESSTLIWTGPGLDREVSYLRNSLPNTPVYVGADEFILNSVMSNANFSDFISTATVYSDASWIQCTNYIDNIALPLQPKTSKHAQVIVVFQCNA